MLKLPFIKMCGVGNDFIILFQSLSKQQIQKMCDRKWGIGADQVLQVENLDQSPLPVKIFNADGSVAKQCGNGMRCLAALVGKDSLALQVGQTIVDSRRHSDGMYSVNMGFPTFPNPRLSEPFKEGCFQLPGFIFMMRVDFVNPHLVIRVKDLKSLDFDSLPALLEKSNLNVHFAEDSSHTEIHVRTWERGVGYTLSCGSGACAVAAAFATCAVGQKGQLKFPGGKLTVNIKNDGFWLKGNATKIFEGHYDLVD